MGLILIPLLVLAGYATWRLCRTIVGKGPNRIRKIYRIDLAALFVLTAAVALAFGAGRAATGGEHDLAFCLVIVAALPAGLAAAWFGRFCIEEFAFLWGNRRRPQTSIRLDWLRERDSNPREKRKVGSSD
jgi:hypothetical protein